LRTPLTRLKLQLEMMGDSPDVSAMKNDIVQMETMISGYLDFARGEEGEKFQAVQLQEVLEQLVISVKRQGTDIVLFVPEEPIIMMLKPTAFERCLNNLTSNAAKYADHIWVSLSESDDEVQIIVEDDGEGRVMRKRAGLALVCRLHKTLYILTAVQLRWIKARMAG